MQGLPPPFGACLVRSSGKSFFVDLGKIVIFVANFKQDKYMEAVIQKSGSGLGINIPRVIVKELSLREGLYVNIYGNGNKIIIDTVKPDVSYNLTDMVEQISESNIHQCIDTGVSTGNEIW